MNKWVIKNSLQKTIFEADLAVIESWNDIVFLYSKITNNQQLYKKNYLFFTTSTNSPFSKDEIIICLDHIFTLLDNNEFAKSLNKDDALNFYELFLEIKSDIVSDSSETFHTALEIL